MKVYTSNMLYLSGIQKEKILTKEAIKRRPIWEIGKKEESIEQFKQIYERDIDYRDVADRVDAYYMNLEWIFKKYEINDWIRGWW